jgi:polyketide synthase PksN
MDSILAMELTDVLERSFGPLSKTLFFEHQTIEALANYFLRAHAARLPELLGTSADASTEPAEQRSPSVPAPRRARRAGALRWSSAASAKMPERCISTALDIAIVGLSGRYPKARNLEEYWENLVGGVDCVSEIPPQRWDHGLYFDARKGEAGKSYSKWGGFIEGVDEFDALFFNISPREAKWMDPQERLFLQCAYSAVQDAGYSREALSQLGGESGVEGSVGVFVGVMYEEYQLYGAQAQGQAQREGAGTGYALGGSAASIANRVSYWFNLHGPSLAVDTMCSSSLTAIHLACRSLTRGELSLIHISEPTRHRP